MKKQGDLWDDSALVNAFDAAISKYKMMHVQNKTQNDSIDGETISSAAVDKTGADIREADENGNVLSSRATELGDTNSLEPIKENDPVDTHLPETYVDTSNGMHMKDSHKDTLYSQATENYSQLMGQYYEIEEKRQKILQQLQQLGTSNYQYSGDVSGSEVQWGAWSSSQENQVSANQACHPTVVCTCCPYVCHSTLTPCSSFPACSLSTTCVGTAFNDPSLMTCSGRSLPCINGDIVKTAMGAAGKAISYMKMKPSVGPCKDGGNDNAEESERQMAQTKSSETDLSVVLNAWYSAGFYTGKYLTEQSAAKK
ncbi:hypothetical protein HS088_TW15G00533 [Tripterygium wilfordii]|uniref:Survival Motor Neuron Gemin2-binding domain-containing protein n=1 Tax=Tripterygium wilfordii TaxID=458696 RepID=A0A7J7CLU9_TRIWF|nr:uncharacterized protein LOC120016306 [Tripterygium wilfordii]KAF5735034.1 hypothetical protein HS088_TW15G00533 [Tripterygium wilfordii]